MGTVSGATDDIIAYGNTASGNAQGAMIVDGTVHATVGN